MAAAAAATIFGVIDAAPANALSESQIKNECQAAGGHYSSGVLVGDRYSSCCYKDIHGHKYCDTYKNGDYTATYEPKKEQPQVDPSPPVVAGVPIAPSPQPLQ
jgi:hypothetical protein